MPVCDGAGKTTLLRLAAGLLVPNQEVAEESHTGKQSIFLVRTDDPVRDPAWTAGPVTLESLVLAYMSRAGGATRDRRSGLSVAS